MAIDSQAYTTIVYDKDSQALGQIHSLERPFDEPHPVLAETNGMVISHRTFPRSQRGDYLIAIVRLWSG